MVPDLFWNDGQDRFGVGVFKIKIILYIYSLASINFSSTNIKNEKEILKSKIPHILVNIVSFLFSTLLQNLILIDFYVFPNQLYRQSVENIKILPFINFTCSFLWSQWLLVY